MQQIIPYSTFENPEDNFDHDIDAPPNTGAQQFDLNINDQTPPATYPVAHREEPPPYAAATYPAATYPKNTNESYHRVTYESYRRWKSDICDCFSNFPICLVTIIPCLGKAFMINMIMHHLRIRNNAASKSKFFIGLAIITILYILRRTTPFFFVVLNDDTTTDESFMMNYVLFWLLSIIFGIFFFCLLFSVRKNVMMDRKIYYSFWENCCTVFWCYSCAICQSANEYSGDDGKQFWKVEIV